MSVRRGLGHSSSPSPPDRTAPNSANAGKNFSKILKQRNIRPQQSKPPGQQSHPAEFPRNFLNMTEFLKTWGRGFRARQNFLKARRFWGE